jgi:hypothetical protein
MLLLKGYDHYNSMPWNGNIAITMVLLLLLLLLLLDLNSAFA